MDWWLRTAAGHELLEDREQLPVLGHGCVGLRRVRHHRAARLVHLATPDSRAQTVIREKRQETQVSKHLHEMSTRAQTVIRENDENQVSKHVHEIAEEL